MKTPEWRHWRLSSVFIVNFKRISHLLVFLFLNLNKQMLAESQVNVLRAKLTEFLKLLENVVCPVSVIQ